MDTGLLVLRLGMGLVMAYHGYMKVFHGQREMLMQGLVQWGWPKPGLFSWLAALSEFLGGILIALGLFTRVGAFFVLFTMTVAFFKAHGHSFEKGGELAYLYGIVALALILTGGGCCVSLDSKLCKKKDGAV